jgi:hypothetical protein
MPDLVTTQILHEDKSRYLVKFTNVSDGGGEADVVKVDVSALTPAAAEVDLTGLWFSTDGMAVRIEWDATTDTAAWLVPANQTGYLDFSAMFSGGIRNDSGTGKTGDVLFTTIGHTSGDTYTIICDFKKRATAEV